MSARTVFTVLTIISSIAMRLSPFPDFYRIHKLGKTGEVQLLPVVALGTNSALIAIYAYTIDDLLPLLATNSFGVLMAAIFTSVFYRYSQDRRYVYKICGVALSCILIMFLYVVLGLKGLTGQSHSQVADTIGWCTVVSSLIQFVSPLATIKRVVQTKSSASIPFALCTMNAINCTLWLTYSLVVSEWIVAAPNFVGSPLGFVQVAVCVIYRPSKLERKQTMAVLPTEAALARGSLSIEIVPVQGDGLGRVPSAVAASDDFIEMASPRKEVTKYSPYLSN